jgi:hypothetical protein
VAAVQGRAPGCWVQQEGKGECRRRPWCPRPLALEAQEPAQQSIARCLIGRTVKQNVLGCFLWSMALRAGGLGHELPPSVQGMVEPREVEAKSCAQRRVGGRIMEEVGREGTDRLELVHVARRAGGAEGRWYACPVGWLAVSAGAPSSPGRRGAGGCCWTLGSSRQR